MVGVLVSRKYFAYTDVPKWDLNPRSQRSSGVVSYSSGVCSAP